MVSVSGGYSTTDHGEYEEWHINSGTRLLINLDTEGEVFENILFDCSNSGASVLLQTYPSRSNLLSSFTVRNIGYSGSFPGGASRPMTVASAGTATIENVYLGDGTYGYPDSSYDSVGGIWAAPEHSGHLQMYRIYCMSWVDNAMYLSAPSWTGGQGTFHLQNCYCKHNQISCFRLCGEDTIENCYGETKSGDHRVMWVYENGGTTTIDNCQFNDQGGTYALRVSSPATISNTEWNSERITTSYTDAGGNGSSPSEFIPQDCPTTALEAATGEGWSDAPSPDPEPNPERSDYDNVLYVDVQDYDDYVTWSADTSSEPVHADYGDATRDGNDYVNDNGDGTWTAGSEAQNYNDAIFFDDSLMGIYSEPVDTGATFELNGQSITPDNWDDSDDGTGDDGDGTTDPEPEPEPEPSGPSSDDITGHVHCQYGDEVVALPVFHPSDVQYPCWRVGLPNGDVGAFSISPRGSADYPALSVATRGGIYAINDASDAQPDDDDDDEDEDTGPLVPVDYDSITIIDDFEDSASVAGWDDEVEITRETSDTAAEGDRIGEFVASGNPGYLGAQSGNTDLPAVPGAGQAPVSAWIRTDAPYAGEIGLEIESEWDATSGTNIDNGYFFGSRNETERWEFYRIDGETWTFLDTVSYNADGNWVRIIWEYTSEGVHDIRLHDENDNFVTSLEIEDSTHSGLGFRVSGAFEPADMDLIHFTGELVDDPQPPEEPEPEPEVYVVDDYEHNDLAANYSSGTGSFEIVSDGYEGSYAVQHRSDDVVAGNLLSLPGDGLDYYPQQGDYITFYFKSNRSSTQTSDSVTHRFQIGVEDANNFYSIQYNLSAESYHLLERSGGSWTAVDTVSNAVSLPADEWIRCEVDWRGDGEIRARYWIDATDEALGGWVAGYPPNHDATDGGVRVNATAFDSSFTLTTDYITLDPEWRDS